MYVLERTDLDVGPGRPPFNCLALGSWHCPPRPPFPHLQRAHDKDLPHRVTVIMNGKK